MSSSESATAAGVSKNVFGRLFKPALAAVMTMLTASALAAPPTQMKLGSLIWIGYGPLYVAEALDLYKKYDLKVSLQMFSDPAMLPPAITSGAVDGATLTYDQVVGQVGNGKKMKVVMPIDYSSGGDAIVTDMSIKSIADFKGKKVGFAPLSPSDFLLTYALSKNGMSEKDVIPVNMTPETVPAAMASGQLKIGVTFEPSVSQTVSQGAGKKFKVIYSSKDAPGLLGDALVFDEKMIQAKPAEITGIIKAYLDGLAYMKAKPEESAKIIGKYMGISPKEVNEQLKSVHFFSADEMAKVFAKSTDTTSYFAASQIIGQLLKGKGEIRQVPGAEATFDPQFVSALNKRK